MIVILAVVVVVGLIVGVGHHPRAPPLAAGRPRFTVGGRPCRHRGRRSPPEGPIVPAPPHGRRPRHRPAPVPCSSVVAGAGVLAAGALLVMIKTDSGFARWDQSAGRVGRRSRHGRRRPACCATSASSAGPPASWPAGLVVAIVQTVRTHRREIFAFLATVFVGITLVGERHQADRRPRPARHPPPHRLLRLVVPVRPRRHGGGDPRRPGPRARAGLLTPDEGRAGRRRRRARRRRRHHAACCSASTG